MRQCLINVGYCWPQKGSLDSRPRLSRQDQLRTRVFTINEGRFMMRAPQLKGKDCIDFPQGQTPPRNLIFTMVGWQQQYIVIK